MFSSFCSPFKVTPCSFSAMLKLLLLLPRPVKVVRTRATEEDWSAYFCSVAVSRASGIGAAREAGVAHMLCV